MHRGLTVGCLLSLFVFAGTASAVLWWLGASWPPSEMQLVIAALSGLCFGSTPLYARGLWSALHDRKLLRDAAMSIPPADGAWGAFTGILEGSSSLLAPMSGAEVLAYRYSVYYRNRHRTNSVGSTYYEGSAMVPSALVTQSGAYRLLAFPVLSIAAEPLDRRRAVERFRAYAAATSFPQPYQPGHSAPAWVLDDPSTHRFDTKVWTEEPEWDDAQLTEQTLRPGEVVTLFGVHRAGQGIGAGSATDDLPEIHRGTPANASRSVSTRLRQAITGLIVLPAFGLAIAWGYHLVVGR